MSRTYHHGKDRRIRVRGIRRPIDVRRLAKALIELEYQAAQAEAEAEAYQEEAKSERKNGRSDSKPSGSDSEAAS